MPDRELLELAAKAAGIELVICADGKPGYRTEEQTDRSFFTGDEWLEGWNPLTDDGDALRLAVKLRIQVTPGTYNKDEFTAFKAGGGEAHEFYSYLQDEYAATRRAIVRAAAQIGRAMP